MNEFEAKREARIERMRTRATAKAAEAEALATKNDALLGAMNGTPVLIGHHSEKRHRRDLDRIHRDLGRSIEARRESEALERRADAAEQSTAVSSDDPNAIEKLRQKLADTEAEGARIVAGLKLARTVLRKNPSNPVAAMKAANVPERIWNFYHFMGALPKTSGNAEARRIKARIADLEAKAARGPKPAETIGEVEISEEDNRVRLCFPGKPTPKVIGELKSSGFRWAPSVGAWVRHASDMAWYTARRIAEGARS